MNVPGNHPDRTFDQDALDGSALVADLIGVTHRAELILMLLVREGLPLSNLTYAALGLVHDTLGSALEQRALDDDG